MKVLNKIKGNLEIVFTNLSKDKVYYKIGLVDKDGNNLAYHAKGCISLNVPLVLKGIDIQIETYIEKQKLKLKRKSVELDV